MWRSNLKPFQPSLRGNSLFALLSEFARAESETMGVRIKSGKLAHERKGAR